jgi:hypothetical protein
LVERRLRRKIFYAYVDLRNNANAGAHGEFKCKRFY